MTEYNDSTGLSAAHGYREQVQGKTYESVQISAKFLRDFSHYLEQAFPSSLEGPNPFAALADYFEKYHPEKSIPSEELSSFLKANLDEKDDLIFEHFCKGVNKFDDFTSLMLIVDIKPRVEAAIEELGLDLRGGVSLGLAHAKGIQAEQQPVFLTETSIINVSNYLTFIAYSLSKLIGKSMSLNKVSDNQFSISPNIDDYKKQLLRDETLQGEWTEFFLSASLNTDKPYSGKQVVVTDVNCASCSADLYEAMCYFIVGHEYGHHIFNHSLCGIATSEPEDRQESYLKELQADAAALHISICIGSKNPFNLFAFSNVAAFTLLTVIDYINKGREILNSGVLDVDVPLDSSHPPLDLRIKLIRNSVYEFIGDEEQSHMASRLINLFSELIEFIWENVQKCLLSYHSEGVRPDQKTSDWLP